MSLKNKPEYWDPTTWSDELVMLEFKVAMDIWTESMFVDLADQVLPRSAEQALESQAFWRSRLDLAEKEAKKRGLI